MVLEISIFHLLESHSHVLLVWPQRLFRPQTWQAIQAMSSMKVVHGSLCRMHLMLEVGNDYGNDYDCDYLWLIEGQVPWLS